MRLIFAVFQPDQYPPPPSRKNKNNDQVTSIPLFKGCYTGKNRLTDIDCVLIC